MTAPYYDLSIIIVSYNTADFLKRCLESLEMHLTGNVRFVAMVVDNNSVDGTRAWLHAYQAGHDWVRTILLDSNVGFARANNIGISRCTSRNVLLLNSDTYLIDDSTLKAVAYLDDRPEIFGCGCTLLDRNEERDVSFGFFPTVSLVVREICTNQFNRLRGVVPGENEPVRPIDFPCGAFFLFKRDLFDKLGGLDERFFMYFEEADLAKRAWDKGYTIILFSPTRIVHVRGGSSGPGGNALTSIFYRSWNYYFKKHHTAVEKIALNCILIAYFSAMIAAASMAGKKSILAYYTDHRRGLIRSWRKNAQNPL
jgi:GT2 family glycosyltransferase